MSNKLTTEEFRNKLKEVRGNEVELLSEYNGSTKPVKIRFAQCGHVVTINKPYNLLNGSNCVICRDHSLRKSPQQFEKEFNELVGDEYTLLTPYKTSRTKIKVKHNKCGNVYTVLPNRFMGGDRCPKCSSNHKLTTSEFKHKLNTKFPNKFIVLGDYQGTSKKIKVRCSACGNEWFPTPTNLLQGHGCPRCRSIKLSKSRRLDKKTILSRIRDNFNDTIKIVDINNYENVNTTLRYKCLVCGNYSQASVGNLLQGHGCPYCANQHRNDSKRLNINIVKKRVKELSSGEYICVGGDYKNNTSPIQLKHVECGTIFTTNFLVFSNGAITCPNCRGSFGEQQIKGYLNTYTDFNYKYGYLIPDLVDKRNLHFDFWLPQVNTAIEYDGQQHFKPTLFNHLGNQEAIKQYELQKKHDKMKNNYCKEKGINLIRIRYDEDVKEVLDLHLLSLVKYLEGIKKDV